MSEEVDLSGMDAYEQAEVMFRWTDPEDLMKDFIEQSLNEANYWAGYKKWFADRLDDEMDIDESLVLTKRAASLKVRLYGAVRERNEHVAERIRKMKAGVVYVAELQAEHDKELTRLNTAVLALGYEVMFQRKAFVEFIGDLGLQLRKRYAIRQKYDWGQGDDG